jgi:hypothetical protein
MLALGFTLGFYHQPIQQVPTVMWLEFCAA